MNKENNTIKKGNGVQRIIEPLEFENCYSQRESMISKGYHSN